MSKVKEFVSQLPKQYNFKTIELLHRIPHCYLKDICIQCIEKKNWVVVSKILQLHHDHYDFLPIAEEIFNKYQNNNVISKMSSKDLHAISLFAQHIPNFLSSISLSKKYHISLMKLFAKYYNECFDPQYYDFVSPFFTLENFETPNLISKMIQNNMITEVVDLYYRFAVWKNIFHSSHLSEHHALHDFIAEKLGHVYLLR